MVFDDEIQASRSLAFLKDARRRGEPIFVPDVVLCEVVGTLKKVYRMNRLEILTSLEVIQNIFEFNFESSDRLKAAVTQFSQGKADFSDYLIRQRCFDAGCNRIATFDKALLNEEGFVEVAG